MVTQFGANHGGATLDARTGGYVGNRGLSTAHEPFSTHPRRNPVRFAAKVHWRHKYGVKRFNRKYRKAKSMRSIAGTM